jgi:protoporphyrinogen oxidase
MLVGIIGAGPAGLAAASYLSKKGIRVCLFEVSPQVGGLTRSFSFGGDWVELGPHFLSSSLSEPIKELFDNFSFTEMREYERMSRIYHKEKYFYYPPRPFNIFRNIGLLSTVQASFSFFWYKFFPLSPVLNAKSFMQNQLGDWLYRYFFASYSEKLWGRKTHELGESYAKSLIGIQDISFMNLFTKLVSAKKTTFDTCLYPMQGMNSLWEYLAQSIIRNGGEIYTSVSITSLLTKGNKTEVKINYAEKGMVFDALISTIPTHIVLSLLEKEQQTQHNSEAERLVKPPFRQLLLVYLEVETMHPISDHCLYIYDKDIPFVRLTNFNAFNGKKDGRLSLLLEYWLDENEPMWHMEEEDIISQAGKDLCKIPDLKNALVKKGEIKKIKNAYVLPDQKHMERLQSLQKQLAQFPGIYSTGRSNAVNFNFSTEDALTEGIRIARTILGERYSEKNE